MGRQLNGKAAVEAGGGGEEHAEGWESGAPVKDCVP